jgi:hypothetical protein
MEAHGYPWPLVPLPCLYQLSMTFAAATVNAAVTTLPLPARDVAQQSSTYGWFPINRAST